jgi:Ca2+-binding EF-hand superfamily protein
MKTLAVYFQIGCLFAALLFGREALSADDILPIMDRDSIAPTVPGKIIRYAAHFMQRYDRNADEILQREEWNSISGSPQAIDLDGDGQITLPELVRYFALYGQTRTIHRSVTVDLAEPYKFDPSKLKLLKPVLQQPAAPPIESAKDQPPTAADLTEETMKLDDQIIDNATYEEVLTNRQIPAERRYYTPPETLRGLPAWFYIRDKDGDGQVSLLEFAPSLSPASLALFGQLDKNGDGFLQPEEVRKPAGQ